MAQAPATLPLWLKIFIGLFIGAEFFVITQWEWIFSRQPPALMSSVDTAPQKAQPRFDFPDTSPKDEAKTAAIQAQLAKRMERITIAEPKVQPNGTILYNGQTIYLYGIKHFESSKVCTRSSGERWACGLHAYATLRNTVANKKIICAPKQILPNGVSASCTLGQSDIALTLVREGLVELDENAQNPEFVNAQASAKSQKIGIWDK